MPRLENSYERRITMDKEDVVSYVKQFYPNTATKDVAKSLNLSLSQVRTLAKQHSVTKCSNYKEELQKQLVVNRKKWFENNIPTFEPTSSVMHMYAKFYLPPTISVTVKSIA